METIKKSIEANEYGYYPIGLLFYVEDNNGYWAKSITIQGAIDKIKANSKMKIKSVCVTVYAITNPSVEPIEAITEIEVLSNGITYQSKNTQRLGQYLIEF